ncbi:hypothetical protein DSL64_07245 [Dyadobacter luteus]|jgi:protein CpxP|uniref:DUF4890 domain-containing protein n=1 Tax=Dyadobacter luteus TaxID=2259619 RepID=A0A3D8YDX7_9BACT|nr:DUF4890 domain-containing protein [Dyadobacter luteus]REA62711.1 hypothetical protein DSL64_07245 [Dyadobacter luteus]
MKKVLIATVLTFAGLTSYAQRPNDNRTPEQRAEAQTKSLTESLKLNDDQQKQIYTLNLERVKQMTEMRESGTPDREKMRASMEAYNTAVNKVLTPEQQEVYKKEMEQRRSGERRRND